MTTDPLTEAVYDERTAALVEALTELLDDYLDQHGPDGYPQPMPQAWQVVQAWLGGPR